MKNSWFFLLLAAFKLEPIERLSSLSFNSKLCCRAVNVCNSRWQSVNDNWSWQFLSNDSGNSSHVRIFIQLPATLKEIFLQVQKLFWFFIENRMRGQTFGIHQEVLEESKLSDCHQVSSPARLIGLHGGVVGNKSDDLKRAVFNQINRCAVIAWACVRFFAALRADKFSQIIAFGRWHSMQLGALQGFDLVLVVVPETESAHDQIFIDVKVNFVFGIERCSFDVLACFNLFLEHDNRDVDANKVKPFDCDLNLREVVASVQGEFHCRGRSDFFDVC